MRQLFGTDGVRGVANTYPMNVEMAVKLGRAAAYVFKNGTKRHKIVIGKDTRLSCYMLENALVAGICSMGVDVLLVGPLPTPGIAFITASMRADAGVVISASHNLYQDNGIKFFSREGFKLPDELEEKIEELIFNDSIDEMRPTASEVGKAFRIDDAVGRYVVFLKNTFPKELSLNGLKIAVDCANGAAYKVAPEVFYELGADVIPVSVKPDGENINYKCGSLHPENIKELVLREKADIGVTLDGDGDRVILVDENGEIVDGDYIMAIAADTMIKEKRLKKNTLVATIMSNMGLFIAVKKAGGRVIQTSVGDRYVVEEMIKGNYNLGGEQSGHIVFLDHNTTGDGILSALQILASMKKNGKPLSQLKKIMSKYPQVLVNVKVQKKNFENYREITAIIKEVEGKLKDKGRVVVRASGTESLIRVMLEGEDKREIQGYADEIAGIIKKKLV